jgi:hypothetical protein
MPLDLEELSDLDLEPIEEESETPRLAQKQELPDTKPAVTIEQTTFRPRTASLEDTRPAFDFDEPLVAPEAVRAAMELGQGGISRAIPLLPEGMRETAQGFKEGIEEQVIGLTTPKSVAMTPIFAIPYVGQGLALGMGAKAIGAGAGTATGAIESGNRRELGTGLSEVTGGAAMVAAPLLHGRAKVIDIPPEVRATLPKASAAVEQTTKGAESAKTIRSDTGQVREEGRQAEVVQDKGGENLQQPAPEQPKPVGARGGEEAQVLLKQELAAPDAQAALTKPVEQLRVELESKNAEADALPKPAADAPIADKMAYLTAKNKLKGEASFLREALELKKQERVKPSQNVITKEAQPERVVVQPPEDVGGGEMTPGYVTIQSKGNAQSGPPEAWKSAGHDLPEFSKLPKGTYGIKEARELAQKAQAPELAAEGVGGVPEKLPAAEAATKTEPVSSELVVESAPERTAIAPETIKAAAARSEDGTIYTGKWHPAAYEELMRAKGLTKDQVIGQIQSGQLADGFITSKGRFVSREEAAVIAKERNQFRPDKEGDIAFAGGLKGMEAGPGVVAPKPELAETQGAIATSGAPMMPATPAGVPAKPVKPISEVIRDLAKGLDMPIRFGRLTTSKYAGYFKKNPNLIGAKFANDMPIVAHETGHKLDSIYPFTKDPALRAELDALGDPAIAGSRSSWTPSKSGVYKRGEGFAEFVRHWLTDPAEAKRLAPDTFTKYEQMLDASEDLGNVMRQAQSDIQLWRNAPQEARLDSFISRSDPNGARYRLPNLMRDVVDDLHFLRMAVDDAKVSGPLPPSQNPYQLARALRGSYGMADSFVRNGVADFKTREVTPGTGLQDALKPVSGRIDEFRRWIVAKRAQELAANGKETGLNPNDVDFVAQKYDTDPAFQEAFTKVKTWNDALLKYAGDSGLIAPESLKAMRDMNQDYVPFHRVFEVGAGESAAQSGGAGRGLNVGKPGSLKRLSGSQRDIVDPLETMVKNAYTLITAAEKNAINTAVADLAPKTDMGRWVEKVAAPKEMVKVELERIKKQLEDAGADLTGVPDDLVMGFFKPSGRAPFGENIIKVNRAGKQEFYRLDKDLFDTFHALDMESSSRLLKLLSAPAQLLRAGVTLTPDFALSNAMRDTVSAAVVSKYGTYPFVNTVKGMAALLNNPKLVSEWAASGGKQSVEANYFDRAKVQKFLSERITKDLTPAERATILAKSPLTALRMFTGTLEEATRIGEYQNALKKLTDEGMPIGDARRQAAFEARDLQDFAKGGAQTKIVRSLAAFWNAGLQGNVRLAQAFRQRPFQTTLKGLAFITLPKLLEQAVNWNDEDYWDRPQWERDLFFMIPRGKDANGHTRFLRIPTPFEVGVIFGTVPGRILQTVREKDPKALESLPRVMLQQTIPNPTPQSVLTLLEVNAGKGGYSFFRGRPIVPEAMKNAPPEMQFTSQNSLTAKKVGKLLNLSPAKVDYAIGGLTGGVGRQLTHQVSDRAISAMTGDERTAQSTMPGARFVATPAGTQSDAVEKFYQALEEAVADRERVKAGEASRGQARFARRLEAVADKLSELRKKAKLEKDEKQRQSINLEISARARDALKQIK